MAARGTRIDHEDNAEQVQDDAEQVGFRDDHENDPEPVLSDTGSICQACKPRLSLEEFKRLFDRKARTKAFQAGLASQAKKMGREGKCAHYSEAEGYAYLGCAPLHASIPACECGWAETCLSWSKYTNGTEGSWVNQLDLRMAKKLFAGKCVTSRMFYYVACVLVSLVGLGLQVYEHSHHFASTGEHEEDSVRQTLTTADEIDQEDQRQALFEEMLENSETPKQVLHKVMQLNAGCRQFQPITANIYRYWAFGCRKSSLPDIIANRMVVFIQIVSPITLIYWLSRRIDWAQSDARLLKYRPGSYIFGINHVAVVLLQLFFVWCISLKCIKTLGVSNDENLRLHLLLETLGRRYSDPTIVRRARWWLLVDRVVEVFVFAAGLISMLLLDVFTDNPKDAIYESFGMLFLFGLHKSSSELAFIDHSDFGSYKVGELAARVLVPLRQMSKDGSFCSEAEQLRKSRGYLIAEMLIWQIMALAPVWELCIRDGMVRKTPPSPPLLWDPELIQMLA